MSKLLQTIYLITKPNYTSLIIPIGTLHENEALDGEALTSSFYSLSHHLLGNITVSAVTLPLPLYTQFTRETFTAVRKDFVGQVPNNFIARLDVSRLNCPGVSSDRNKSNDVTVNKGRPSFRASGRPREKIQQIDSRTAGC